MTATTRTRHEQTARLNKAHALVNVLLTAGATPEDLDDEQVRKDAEAAAHVRPASDTTWDLVREILGSNVVPHPRARKVEQPADPFDDLAPVDSGNPFA